MELLSLAEVRKVMSRAMHTPLTNHEGAVGVEMAAELKLVQPELKVILIHSRDLLLSSEPLSDEFKQQTLAMLRRTGVEVIVGQRVNDVSESHPDDPTKKTIKLSDGTEVCVSEVIKAVSRPTSTASYLPPDVLDDEGLIPITPELRFHAGPNAEVHFAIGDLVARAGIKRCGGALYTGGLAAQNIRQHILFSKGLVREPEYVQYPEYPPAIAVAVGDDAISYSSEQGVASGKAVMDHFFQNDLGLKMIWDYLQLGKPPGKDGE